VFDAVKLAFAAALQHGFVAILIISVLAVLAAFFLKDLPMTQLSANETETSEAEGESEVDAPVVI
jgi:ABC-type nickel/cobalt efflux system permease component RcnA